MDFTRTAGKAEVDVTFPVDGKLGLLSIGAWGQLYFSGHPAFEENKNAVHGIYLQTGRRYSVIVEVRRDTLTAIMDGKLMVSIDRKKSTWESNPHWRVPDQDAFGLGSWDSDVLFHRVAVRDIAGQGRMREPDSDLARISMAAHWADAVDLLAKVDLKKRFSSGHWIAEDGILKVEKAEDQQWARMELGYTPPGGINTISASISGALKAPKTSFKFALKTALRSAGNFRPATSPCSTRSMVKSGSTVLAADWLTIPHLCNDLNPHTSVVCVRKDGLKAFVDGKLTAKWKTDYSDMGIDIWKLKHPVLGVGANLSSLYFDKILVKDITGHGTLDAPSGLPKDDAGF